MNNTNVKIAATVTLVAAAVVLTIRDKRKVEKAEQHLVDVAPFNDGIVHNVTTL